MNELLSPRRPEEEKASIIFFTVFVLLLIVDTLIMYPNVDSWYEIYDIEEKDWNLEYESFVMVEESSITLSDGGSEILTFAIAENYSMDGWMIQSITSLIDYDESAFGDADCDTVSSSLSFIPNTQVVPESESLEETVSDCSQIELSVAWHQPPSNASAISEEDIDPEFRLEAPPLTLDVEITLNVDSTIPNNDNDEQINMELVIELVRIFSVEQN